MQFDQSDPNYLEGMKCYLSSDWKNAEIEFRKLKEKYPESTFILLILGDIYYSLGRLDESLDVYKKSLEINPEYYIIYYKMGVSAYRAGKEQRCNGKLFHWTDKLFPR